MTCRLLLAIFICLLAQAASAEPLLLRFETVGFENAGQKSEKRKLIRSLEVVTEPGAVFYARAVIGGESLLISGSLELVQDGDCELQLRNAYSKNRQADGKTSSTSSQGPILVQLGKRVVVSGVESTRQAKGGTKQYSLIQNAVIVTKFDPASLTPARKGRSK